MRLGIGIAVGTSADVVISQSMDAPDNWPWYSIENFIWTMMQSSKKETNYERKNTVFSKYFLDCMCVYKFNFVYSS